MSSAVTRDEFNELIGVVQAALAVFAAHRHDLMDTDGGGETYGPDRYAQDDLTLVTNRLAALAQETSHAD